MMPMSAFGENDVQTLSTVGDGSTVLAPRRPAAGLRRALPQGLRVVLYHHLAKRSTELADPLHVNTAPALFEAHIQRLVRDYDIVDLETVLSGRLPRRALLITFDDGYRSVLDVGLPILARHGLPSVFFVSRTFLDPTSLPLDNLLCGLASRIGVEALAEAVLDHPTRARTVEQLIELITRLPYARRSRLGEELAERFCVDVSRTRAESGLFLDLCELQRLAELGCEVANHTRSHIRCRSIVDEAVGMVELVQHQQDLQHWAGAQVRAFAYPYGSRGDATPLVERLLAESGHEASFLVESRPNREGHAGRPWNRVSLHHHPTSRLLAELELLPQLRAMRDLLQASS